MTFNKEDVRVVEPLSGGSLITLIDGAQFHVVEEVDSVLRILKDKGAAK